MPPGLTGFGVRAPGLKAGRGKSDAGALRGSIPAVLSPDLASLGQRRQRVGNRHLARFVAFETHLLEDLATREPAACADYPQQFFASAAAACPRGATGPGPGCASR